MKNYVVSYKKGNRSYYKTVEATSFYEAVKDFNGDDSFRFKFRLPFFIKLNLLWRSNEL